MKLQNLIKKISRFFTLSVIYAVCATTYMSVKGFVYEDGKIFLANTAQAQDDTKSFAKPAEKHVLINLSNPHFLGDENAPLTLYEYSSFGCTHCADFHLSTIKKLEDEYIKTGKLKIILVYFPIDKKSMQAAMIASCIPDEEYHAFVDTVFKKQREWSLSNKAIEVLSEYASFHGISKLTALECTKNDKIASEILGNRQQGMNEFQINGTPTFVVDDGKKQEIIPGAPSFSALKKYLDEKLQNI